MRSKLVGEPECYNPLTTWRSVASPRAGTLPLLGNMAAGSSTETAC
jgi:hypothetical protein